MRRPVKTSEKAELVVLLALHLQPHLTVAAYGSLGEL